MKIKSVVAGTLNKVIFELDNGLYAIVGLNGGVRLSWYWLYIAKNMPVIASDMLDDKMVEDARKAFEKAVFDDSVVNNVLHRRKDESMVFEYQKEFLDALKERGEPMYFT